MTSVVYAPDGPGRSHGGRLRVVRTAVTRAQGPPSTRAGSSYGSFRGVGRRKAAGKVRPWGAGRVARTGGFRTERRTSSGRTSEQGGGAPGPRRTEPRRRLRCRSRPTHPNRMGNRRVPGSRGRRVPPRRHRGRKVRARCARIRPEPDLRGRTDPRWSPGLRGPGRLYGRESPSAHRPSDRGSLPEGSGRRAVGRTCPGSSGVRPRGRCRGPGEQLPVSRPRASRARTTTPRGPPGSPSGSDERALATTVFHRRNGAGPTTVFPLCPGVPGGRSFVPDLPRTRGGPCLHLRGERSRSCSW